MSAVKFLKTYHNPNSLYINTESKWLWLRIHKTAGTSMYDGFLRDHCLNIAKQEQKPQVLRWISAITDAELEQYTIWTCVRNPYDRFNSMAAMFKKDPNQFAQDFHTLRNGNRVINRHTEPQHLFTHHDGVQVPNHVIYFESLQYGFDNVCDKIGLKRFQLPHLNVSRLHEPWQETFTPETIDFVNNHFALDFKYFNYKIIK